MLDDRMDLFVIAYDSPTFSAAAAKIPMSPQGFTKAIRNLERDLGVPLFAVDDSGVRKPTEYADEFYLYAKQQQAERERLRSAFEQISSKNTIELKVACALGIPGLFGSEMFERFAAKYENVSVTFTELPDSLCDSVVAEGHFNIGISLQPADNRLKTKDVFTSPVMFWVNKDDPLFDLDVLSLSDLSGRLVAMPGEGFRCFQNLKAAFSREGLELPRIVEYAEIFWIYYFVRMGKGLGFCLPHLSHLDMFEESDDCIKAMVLEGLDWRVCATWLKTRELTPIEADFLEHVARRARALKKKA